MMNNLLLIFQRNLSRQFSKGDTAVITKKITLDDVNNFMEISGDNNPIHVGKRAVVHGALLNSILSSVIGTKLPGHGTLVLSQNLNFPNKCYADDVVTFKVVLAENRKVMKVNFTCKVESENKIVLYGDAKLMVKDVEDL